MNSVWVKSSFSGSEGSCVEVDSTSTPGTIRMRDSKLGEASPVLNFNKEEWEAFRLGVVDGQFNF